MILNLNALFIIYPLVAQLSFLISLLDLIVTYFHSKHKYYNLQYINYLSTQMLDEKNILACSGMALTFSSSVSSVN